ncbi:MAG: hypothetical protein OXC30_00175 [Alphaproteobacteria bacterium]|nr:hypothetical protein [Alphaproteobacteria bacterium]
MTLILLFLICFRAHGASLDAIRDETELSQAEIARLQELGSLSNFEQAMHASCQATYACCEKVDAFTLIQNVKSLLISEKFLLMDTVQELIDFVQPIKKKFLAYHKEKYPEVSDERMRAQVENMLSPKFHINPELFMHALVFVDQRYLIDANNVLKPNNSNDLQEKYVSAYRYILYSCYYFYVCENNKVANQVYEVWRTLPFFQKD